MIVRSHRPQWLFTVMIPAVWASTCYVGSHFPGDEYGLWGVASLPGIWLPVLVGVVEFDDVVWLTIAAGSVAMSMSGAVLDRLRSSVVVWYALWIVSASVLCWLMLRDFPSWSRAIAKNGSFNAYALSALNLGLLLATIVTALGTGFQRALARSIIGLRGRTGQWRNVLPRLRR